MHIALFPKSIRGVFFEICLCVSEGVCADIFNCVVVLACLVSGGGA